VVKALCCKPEGRGFDTRRGDFLNLPNTSGRTRPWVYSASNRNEYQKHKSHNVSGNKARSERRADILTAIYEPIV
jgi:hypothetical protein